MRNLFNKKNKGPRTKCLNWNYGLALHNVIVASLSLQSIEMTWWELNPLRGAFKNGFQILFTSHYFISCHTHPWIASTYHITPCWAPPPRRLPKQTLKNFNWCPLRRNCRTLLKRCFFPLLGSRRCLSGINHFAHVQKDMLMGLDCLTEKYQGYIIFLDHYFDQRR